MKKTEDSGNNHKLAGQIVTFRREISVGAKNVSGPNGNIKIPAGTVGTLTGGFINKNMSGRLITLLDVKIGLLSDHREFHLKYLMIVSAPLDALRFGTGVEIN